MITFIASHCQGRLCVFGWSGHHQVTLMWLFGWDILTYCVVRGFYTMMIITPALNNISSSNKGEIDWKCNLTAYCCSKPSYIEMFVRPRLLTISSRPCSAIKVYNNYIYHCIGALHHHNKVYQLLSFRSRSVILKINFKDLNLINEIQIQNILIVYVLLSNCIIYVICITLCLT